METNLPTQSVKTNLRSTKTKQPKRIHNLTIPGYNYAGSGTDIIGNLDKGLEPVSELDYYARNHDVAYLLHNNQKKADTEMVSALWESNPILAGAAKAVFTIKDIIGYDPPTDNNLHNLATQMLESRKQTDNFQVSHFNTRQRSQKMTSFLSGDT